MDSSSDRGARPDGVPEYLGPYRILERIGEGGMGTVFVADQTEPVRRRVALKVIRADRMSKTYRARFELERRALERMDHPNIARIFDAGITADGMPYFAMELVHGHGLTEYCDSRKLAIPERLRIFRQVCDGVQHAHLKGILHRDLKPSNILVTEVDGRPLVKIIDFGLARATDLRDQRPTLFEELKRIIGTIAYMSPEQAGLTMEDVDTRTDVYSLGVILYELATGQLPFDVKELRGLGEILLPQFLREHDPKTPSTRLSELGEEIVQVAARRSMAPQRLRAAVSGELDWVTMRALERQPARRYLSPLDLGRDIDRLLAHEPVEAGPPGALYRLRKWAVRNRIAIAMTAIVVAGIGGTASVGMVLGQEARAASLRRDLLLEGSMIGALLEQADADLWPARERMIPLMEHWQVSARHVLARRQQYDELARELADKTVVGEAEDGLLQYERKQVARFVEDFGALSKVLGDMDRRIALARRCRRESVDSHAKEWRDQIEAIARSDKYREKVIAEPIDGLVPLGFNRQGLAEFLVLQSHAESELPQRRADGGFDVHEGTGVILVLVPRADGWMGSAKGPGAHNPVEQPLPSEPEIHCVLDPFLLSKYEMSRRQWLRMQTLDWGRPPDSQESERLDPSNPTTDEDSHRDRLQDPAPHGVFPVNQVSWLDAKRNLCKLGLSLRTEAQWECACRAGTTSPWSWGNDVAIAGDYGNFADKSARESFGVNWPVDDRVVDGRAWPAPVDRYRPNAFGFHNMLGNVGELCADAWSDPPEKGTRTGDGLSPAVMRGERTVYRGGSFRMVPGESRSGSRVQIPIYNRAPTGGVRPGMTIE